MAKHSKNIGNDLYYMNKGQVSNNMLDEKEKKRKAKEREKRIKERKKENDNTKIDEDLETVINMTNRNRIKKEEQRRKIENRKIQKKKKKYKKIKFFLKLFIIIGLIAGATVFAMTSPIFNIKDIKVLNNTLVSSETVISLSGLKQDENIFRFYNGTVAEKIEKNPYIKEAIIHRKLPNTIEIEVTERQPKFSVDFMGKFAYIDNQGYILEISEDSKQMPIIRGISTAEEEVTPGSRLNSEDLEKLEDVLEIYVAFESNELASKITSIDITDKNEYSIYLEEEQKTIHLGDNSNLNNKILYILTMLEHEAGIAGDIYVNGDLNNKFQPYFREKVTI